jgi:hypothetical protein
MLWLDVVGLCRATLPEGFSLGAVRYCTAPPIGDRDKHARHADYINAITTVGDGLLTLHEGKHRAWSCRCEVRDCDCSLPRESRVFKRHVEKKTDCQLCTLMLLEALRGDADRLVLVSADSDYVPPVRAIAELDDTPEIVLALPPGAAVDVNELRESADSHFRIDPQLVRDNQLPDRVGYRSRRLSCPQKWIEDQAAIDAEV